MALAKNTIIDKIEIIENTVVQYRRVSIITDNGVEIAKSYHRGSIEPGQDYSALEPEIKKICKVVHTPDVISAFKANLRG